MLLRKISELGPGSGGREYRFGFELRISSLTTDNDKFGKQSTPNGSSSAPAAHRGISMVPFSQDWAGADPDTTSSYLAQLTGRVNKRPFVRAPHDNPAPSARYLYPSRRDASRRVPTINRRNFLTNK